MNERKRAKTFEAEKISGYSANNNRNIFYAEKWAECILQCLCYLNNLLQFLDVSF